MPQLILTEEQAKILASARERIEVRDPKGRVVGQLDPPITEELLAELKRRRDSSNGGIPSHRVQAMLQELEKEWQRTGGFDRQYLAEFLQRFKAEGRE